MDPTRCLTGALLTLKSGDDWGVHGAETPLTVAAANGQLQEMQRIRAQAPWDSWSCTALNAAGRGPARGAGCHRPG